MDVQMDNQAIIEAYLKYKQMNNNSRREDGISKGTLKNKRNCLQPLSNSMNHKSFKETTREDIENYLMTGQKKNEYKQSSKNSKIPILRDFYRWLFDLEEYDPLPDCIRKIKPRFFEKDPIKEAEKVISPEEYAILMENASKPIHRAILEAFWITGGRKEEIQTIRVGDVTFDGKYTRVIVRISKTKSREVIYPGRAEHLLKWSETLCPYVGQKNMPLFVVNHAGKGYTHINRSYAWDVVNSLAKKVGIKHINVHAFRHTRASKLLADGVPETNIKTLMGWSKSSQMLKIYDHNGIKEVEEHFNERNTRVKPTYDLLEKQKQELETKHEQEIARVKAELEQMKEEKKKNEARTKQLEQDFAKFNKRFEQTLRPLWKMGLEASEKATKP